jgi:pimeloyl-ACP methyl ester carboxylesterase
VYGSQHPKGAYRERGLMLARLVVGLIAMAAIAVGALGLRDASDGLRITRAAVGPTPITIFRPDLKAPAPVVVIAHGFAGSQQLMQPFATTLARNGYIAVTFDFLGHGRNPLPMRGDITRDKTITAALMRELADVAAYARELPGSDRRLAVIGHSMAADIVVRFAQVTPNVEATVAVSVFSPMVTATSPRNLLVIVGDLEPAMLKNEGLRIVNLVADGEAIPSETYGRFSDGTARRLVLARGVEHIGVLYSHDSLEQALRWINEAFGRNQQGFIDNRGTLLALVFFGLIALAWPMSALLTTICRDCHGAGLGWKPLLVTAIAPALLTPIILWKLPTNFLPILLGDYLALHFLLYGVLTAAFLSYLGGKLSWSRIASTSWTSVAIAAATVAAYQILAFGFPVDAYVFSFFPVSSRLPLMVAIAGGTLPYFVADEWLTRGVGARPGAYALTKFCFVLSLALAVALNPMKLFFLVIIVPAILLLFLAFGLISRWSYQATRHPLPGALANAATFAWAIAVTFPMIER